MTTKEFREMSDKELQVKLNELRLELVNLRVRKQTGQVEKPHRMQEIRRSVARILTVLTAKHTKELKAS